MPGRDGTGPMGMGAMTGRAAGWCVGFSAPAYANPIPGRGFGMGFGRGSFGGRGGGRGRRNMYYATGLPGWMRDAGYAAPYGIQSNYMKPDPEMEKQNLRVHADALQSELEFIRKRLDEIEKENKAD